ncbi:hypothetical protein ABPG73_010426 [Tetrahymena malaccensis]
MELVAIKILNKFRRIDNMPNLYFESEKQITSNLADIQNKSANIANIIEVFPINDGQSFMIVQEYCEFGDLYQNMIANRGLLNERTKLIYCILICEGLVFLHNNNIVHRDLKPENILIAYQNNQYRLKITDYGLCKQSEELLDSFVGTITYMAPEILLQQRYSNRVDIWSMGCIMDEIVRETTTFEGESIQNIRNNIINYSGYKQNNFLSSIISKCLKMDPNDRIDSFQLLQELNLLLDQLDRNLQPNQNYQYPHQEQQQSMLDAQKYYSEELQNQIQIPLQSQIKKTDSIQQQIGIRKCQVSYIYYRNNQLEESKQNFQLDNLVQNINPQLDQNINNKFENQTNQQQYQDNQYSDNQSTIQKNNYLQYQRKGIDQQQYLDQQSSKSTLQYDFNQKQINQYQRNQNDDYHLSQIQNDFNNKLNLNQCNFQQIENQNYINQAQIGNQFKSNDQKENQYCQMLNNQDNYIPQNNNFVEQQLNQDNFSSNYQQNNAFFNSQEQNKYNADNYQNNNLNQICKIDGLKSQEVEVENNKNQQNQPCNDQYLNDNLLAQQIHQDYLSQYNQHHIQFNHQAQEQNKTDYFQNNDFDQQKIKYEQNSKKEEEQRFDQSIQQLDHLNNHKQQNDIQQYQINQSDQSQFNINFFSYDNSQNQYKNQMTQNQSHQISLKIRNNKYFDLQSSKLNEQNNFNDKQKELKHSEQKLEFLPRQVKQQVDKDYQKNEIQQKNEQQINEFLGLSLKEIISQKYKKLKQKCQIDIYKEIQYISYIQNKYCQTEDKFQDIKNENNHYLCFFSTSKTDFYINLVKYLIFFHFLSLQINQNSFLLENILQIIIEEIDLINQKYLEKIYEQNNNPFNSQLNNLNHFISFLHELMYTEYKPLAKYCQALKSKQFYSETFEVIGKFIFEKFKNSQIQLIDLSKTQTDLDNSDQLFEYYLPGNEYSFKKLNFFENKDHQYQISFTQIELAIYNDIKQIYEQDRYYFDINS